MALALFLIQNWIGSKSYSRGYVKFSLLDDKDEALSFNLIITYEHLEKWEDAYNTAKAYASKYPDDANGQKEYLFLQSRVTQ